MNFFYKYLIFLIGFCAVPPIFSYSNDKIKLYTIYTPSHAILFNEWFLPSLNAHDDYELIVEYYGSGGSGNYLQRDWQDAIRKKVDLILKAIKENWGKIFVFSDADIQFFGPSQQLIKDLMADNDMIIQKESPERNHVCTGFFALLGNEQNLNAWQQVKQNIFKNGSKLHDQDVLNEILFSKNSKNLLKWQYLPVEKFFGGGTFTGKGWKPGMFLPVPKDPVMHHANWTVGVSNKIAQLRYVKEKLALSMLPK